MAWTWYGVKTLYRVEAHGQPVSRDRDYDPKGTLVEERVLLVRARSHAEAIRRAEAEARAYAAGGHTNTYNQKVRIRRLRIAESFELFDAPASMKEVWSATWVVPVTTSDQKVITRAFGPEETRRMLKKRKKYLNRRFARRIRADV